MSEGGQIHICVFVGAEMVPDILLPHTLNESSEGFRWLVACCIMCIRRWGNRWGYQEIHLCHSWCLTAGLHCPLLCRSLWELRKSSGDWLLHINRKKGPERKKIEVWRRSTDDRARSKTILPLSNEKWLLSCWHVGHFSLTATAHFIPHSPAFLVVVSLCDTSVGNNQILPDEAVTGVNPQFSSSSPPYKGRTTLRNRSARDMMGSIFNQFCEGVKALQQKELRSRSTIVCVTHK